MSETESNPIVKAQEHSSAHREEVTTSDQCGCFYCLNIFTPDKIIEWIDEGTTAICPTCGIDSVIGSRSGYPITIEFLSSMKRHWV